ncbi:hypothetical protein L6452_38000 [Arctium lappa]|uniref:Uncharacterized protein n=1 Tax=Arctium lappa TaxID=4217 RepID=A0ACB8Y510_ARCLA|nr:hypothetical protein L6452_38000 [Arctium lappa]
MPMEGVHKPTVLLLALFMAFSSLTTLSECRKANLGNHDAKNGEKGAKGEDHTKIPSNGFPYPGENIGYPQDLYGSMASMYFPAPAEGFRDMNMVKDGQKRVDGQKEALLYGGSPPVGYGYPFPFPFSGGIFGFPGGIFGFPQSIFGFPRSIFGFPPFGGVPGGYGRFPGGYGGSPGGYGGNPGGYGSGRPGNKPGGGGYPGYGGKAEMKGKEVNSHD